MLARRLRNTPEGLAASLRGVGTGALPSLWERLREIKLPVLCLAGGQDAKFRAIADEMATRLPAGTVSLVEGAYHVPHLEKPAATAEAIRRFLAEQARP
jgi:pimeloyl-ACP methyl ester carboxylesterase